MESGYAYPERSVNNLAEAWANAKAETAVRLRITTGIYRSQQRS